MEDQQNYKDMLDEDRGNAQTEIAKEIVKSTAKKALYKFLIGLVLGILPYVFIFALIVLIIVVFSILDFNFTGTVPGADMKELKSLGIKDNSQLMTLTTGVQFNQE